MGNLSIDTDGRFWRCRAPSAEGSKLVVPRKERRAMIRRFHDSLFVFLGQFSVFRHECIGQDCGMMFGHILHRVQYA